MNAFMEDNAVKEAIKDTNNKGFIKKYLPFVWEVVKIMIVAAAIVLPVRYFLFQPFIVKGESMVPNFHSGDYLIVNEIFYKISNPKRGDVVVLKYPFDLKQRFIKRIIGLPGETVVVKDGKITISSDGKSVLLDEEKYLSNIKSTDGNVNVNLGADEYFVLGDNRPSSYDSRRWGILPKEDIIGRAMMRIYPFTNMSYIATPSY